MKLAPALLLLGCLPGCAGSASDVVVAKGASASPDSACFLNATYELGGIAPSAVAASTAALTVDRARERAEDAAAAPGDFHEPHPGWHAVSADAYRHAVPVEERAAFETWEWRQSDVVMAEISLVKLGGKWAIESESFRFAQSVCDAERDRVSQDG